MHLFVYGTLRRCFDNPMARTLRANAEFAGEAVVEGTVYQVHPRYPGLIPGLGLAEGELYRLKNFGVLEELDRYEGCSAEDPLPHEYRRDEMAAVLPDGSSVTAWVYVYQRDVTGCDPVPTRKTTASSRLT
jgi:gamma-glutamylcyclotransferase (GGCT)/AIG2-like uncharacterized protein YtfP